MRDPARTEAQAESEKPGPSVRLAAAGAIALTISMALGVGLVGWIFLDRYRDPAQVSAAGSDTAQHLWRIQVVADGGLDALPPFDGTAQALNTNADRPGLPITGAIVSAAGIAEPAELVYVLPAVMAAITGLAAAGFARAAMRAQRWSLPAYLVGVGASVHVALSANGYLDQLLVMPLLIGAGTCVVAAAADRRVYLTATFLLGAAFAVHWQFAAAFTGLLAFVSLGAIAVSLDERRAGSPWQRLPVVSSLVTTGGGLLVGAAVLLGIPGSPRTPLGVTREGLEANLERQLPLYRFPVPALAAASGAVAALLRKASRPSLWLLAPWALTPAVAALLFEAGRTVPVQRALMFALAIPILGVGLLEALVRAGQRFMGRMGSQLRARAGAVALALLALVPIAWSAAQAHDAWTSRPVPISDDQLADLQATARYIAASGRPAVVVVDVAETDRGAPGADFGSVPMLRRLRAQMEPGLILDVTPYLGDPAELLVDSPTLRPEVPGFDETSLELWGRVQPLLARDPVVIVLEAFHDSFDRLVRDRPDWQATQGLAIVRGPRAPLSSIELPEPAVPAFGSLVAKALLLLGAASVVGAGWAWATGPGDGAARWCLAPATGLAVLVLAGLAAEHLGIRAGRWGAAIAIVAALAGLAATAFPLIARRTGSPDTHEAG